MVGRIDLPLNPEKGDPPREQTSQGLTEDRQDDFERTKLDDFSSNILNDPIVYSPESLSGKFVLFSLGMKSYARARDMIKAGLAIALATDFNPGSCNCDSMQFVITLACLQMKMTPAEAITASTINAAYSLGLGDKIGSIEIGKKADILIMDMPSYQYLPYHFGSNNVETVIKNGKVIR